jgi:hypothetical protein
MARHENEKKIEETRAKLAQIENDTTQNTKHHKSKK